MNVKVITVPVGPLSANCHIVYGEDMQKALIIDPGGDFSILMQRLNAINKSAGAVILTHGHFDHIMATNQFQELGVPVYMHQSDEQLINSNGNLAKYFGIKFQPFNVDNRLIEGDIEICGYNLTVYETPGHTQGGVCIKMQNLLFTGDTLFEGSYGRTDFPGGNAKHLAESIKKLFTLQEDLILYTGHGNNTYLQREKQTNPIKFLF